MHLQPELGCIACAMGGALLGETDMRFTMKTRDYGTLEFFAPRNGGYVRLESDGKPGTLGQQICNGGGFLGNTISCGPTEESLSRVARAWQRQRREGNKQDFGWEP